MKLTKDFFTSRDTLTLARDILGKLLVKQTKKGRISGIICETEAYVETDEAAHTFRGKTKRNWPMFEEAGYAYVYSMRQYSCFDVSSEFKGYGSGILIRAVIPQEGIEIMCENKRNFLKKYHKTFTPRDVSDIQALRQIANGPAKLCMLYDIDAKRDNGMYLLADDSPIWFEDIDYHIPMIYTGPRIGISKGLDKDWRFWF